MNIGLFYDDDAYVEPTTTQASPTADRAAGLVGRQVAGRAFLEAYFNYGDWSELAFLVRHHAAAASLEQFCRANPSNRPEARRLRIFEERRFLDDFDGNPPARLLYFPCPIDSRYAWARQTLGSNTFSLSGVTHTLCTANVVKQLCEFVTAPFEPHDALICTSTAVAKMVRAVTDHYASDLRDRQGGDPCLNIRLETIPLGVDTDRFRPPTAEERSDSRRALKVADDEVAILFVGRLAHHGKAHPFPMFRSVERAARASAKKVHLLMAGWAPNRAIRDAFVEGARAFAPTTRVSFLDGMNPINRSAVWKAADVLVSLVDNIQETFGLVITEAMASGLPVVATDWDGYRDLVVDGRTGYLIPTTMVRGASGSATSRLMFGAIDYDHFLAEISQTVAVDVASATEALTALILDPALRRSLGNAGRARALERFAWPKVILAYESIWREQESIRQNAVPRSSAGFQVPANYPPPDTSFAGYPTHWLDPSGPSKLVATPGSLEELAQLLTLPLTNHVADRRVARHDILEHILKQAQVACPVEFLMKTLESSGVDSARSRATIAWMLKYNLLSVFG